LQEGKVDHQIGCVLDPFQEEVDVPVPFQSVVFARPTAHVVEVDAALVQEDEKWVELVVQGVELRTVEVVDVRTAVAVQTGLEVVGLVHVGEIPHLGQTADQAVLVGEGHCCMVELHPWAELVVVQELEEEADCNGMADFAHSALALPSTPVDWCFPSSSVHRERASCEGAELGGGSASVRAHYWEEEQVGVASWDRK
jgi:hypothetical protein